MKLKYLLLCVCLYMTLIPATMAKSYYQFAAQQWWFTPASVFQDWIWQPQTLAADWQARAGLQVVEKRGAFYLMGGRTPVESAIFGDSIIHGDVWKSTDKGVSWRQILETDDSQHWPARAYFQALQRGSRMYILGGQNFKVIPNNCPPFVPECPPFVSQSDFFNDVWSSRDGVNWKQLTANAGWTERAGLSAAVHRGALYVAGGSRNDDSAVVAGPQPREYFNDVWKSYNGRDWKQVTDNAPWAARAGGVLVSKGGYLYMIGGEDGFTCEPLPFCTPPYFNDVWRSKNGKDWQQMTASAAWPARPGHQCVAVYGNLMCFGGFGLLQNPSDVWVSRNGANWQQVSDAPWNVDPNPAPSPTNPFGLNDVKYDFDALVVREGRWGLKQVVYSFGGDRERFNLPADINVQRVDNDVWRFQPPQ
ncbi:hypothetical protein [Paraferrimonas haliotis]|uniref:Uncharacterized protein n=1 Tax=Paraferrimonas haliotis TaxID=2013866 RepID=A0AA37TKT7_9GAMM|nr:hypothetical protein [Paraferrimonas haliotis]GLS83009.1 hypothetical protein GCM10007894_09860 [Paraferrimonas haliotis]